MADFDWKKYLKECLDSTDFCCLATVDASGVWSNPVYFAYDDKLNIYFISQPGSRHMQNLVKDQRIAISIFSTAQDTFGDIIGIQLEGKAEILNNLAGIERAYSIYYGRRYPSGEKAGKSPEDYLGDQVEWQFVKVTPSQVYYFDTRFFDEVRQPVPVEALSL